MIETNKDGQYLVATAAPLSCNTIVNGSLQFHSSDDLHHWNQRLTSPVLTPSVSFFQRIIPFGNRTITSNTNGSNSERCSEWKANKKQSTIDEIKSVQSLKQFWISAFGGGGGGTSGTSCKCAINCVQPPNSASVKSATLRSTITESARAKCLSLDRSSNVLSDKDQRCCASSSPLRKSNIDNFYKYKTADLVKNNRISDIHSQCGDWVRDMKLMSSPSASSDESTFIKGDDETNMQDRYKNINHDKNAEICAENGLIVSTVSTENNKMLISSDKETVLSEKRSLSKMTTKTTTTTMAADKKCDNSAAYTAPATDKITASISSKSTNSSTSSLASESPRKHNITTRKCSFRTNNFHHHHHHAHHRKMATMTVNGSKVAALTHRFNQLIQQDAEILEEVKRNKEVILHRLGGHVFKVKEETENNGRKRSAVRKNDSNPNSPVKLVKKKSSVKRRSSVKLNKSEAMKNTVEICAPDALSQGTTENVASVASVPKIEKPKVPDKSAEVLQRTKEIAIMNSLKRIKNAARTHIDVKEKDEKAIARDRRKTLENIKEVLEEREEKLDLDVFCVEKTISEPSDTTIKICDRTPEPDNEEKTKKSRYTRLYEKLRFKTPFTTLRKNQQNKQPEQMESTEPVYSVPEQKIVDAICSVNERIDQLSKSEICLILPDCKEPRCVEVTKDMKPNNSFLFRSTYKPIFNSSYEISCTDYPAEAINQVLISKTRSMDEACFPSSQKKLFQQVSLEEKNFNAICQRTDDLLSKLKDPQKQEDGYEIIKPSEELLIVQDGTISMDLPDTAKKPIESFVHKEYQKINVGSKKDPMADSSIIYQSISEAISTTNSNQDCDSLNSYESFENYEAVDEMRPNFKTENGYEICDPPTPPEPPPPRKPSDAEIINKVPKEPQIPVPKRNLHNSQNHLKPSDNVSFSNYEKIKYDTATPLPFPPPLRPPKSPHLNVKLSSSPNPSITGETQSIYTEYRDYDYEENIYDTIKTADSTSMATDYESIHSATNFLRTDRGMKHSDSTSTLSSDIKTNSLYGTTICGRGITPPSEGGSDNSDEWIDISDGEGEKKHKFIVICQRKKSHRSPDWSRKVHDQRMNKRNQELYEDDSDHYYESLDAAEHVKPTNYSNAITTASSSVVSNETLTLNHVDTIIHEDFDSFDSDDYSDEDVRKNDSGVDVSNTRLPDPPTHTSQVYSFMQKIKNFGSISKSLTKLTKKKSPSILTNNSTDLNQPKQKYENTQFYVENDYQNVVPKSRNKSKSKSMKLIKKKETSTDPYENTEFHSPRNTLQMPTNSQSPDISASSPTLSHIDSSSTPRSESEMLSRKKSKSGKSFKSKFRKNLGPDNSINLGSSLNGNRSTFYVTDSVDVDSGIFSSTDKVPTADDLPPVENFIQKSDTIAADTTHLVTMRSGNYISPESNRRRSSLGIRPNNPPPPPPVDHKKLYKSKRLGTTSWYAECGVFKSDTLSESQADSFKNSKKDVKSNSSWYADAGLYQTSGASVASSSGSSGVSTGGECGPGDDNSHSMFLNEPLYQIYSQAKLESLTKDIELENENSDGYEEIGGSQQPLEEEKKPLRPTALQLVGPKQGPSRTLWSEIPEVINSQILSTLTSTEKRLQEAKFEILTSEASYLKSLTLLRTHFMNHPAFRDTSVLSSSDRKILFSYIVSVQECSDRLLCDLENCWQDNIMLLGLSHSVYKHAEKYFHVYVTYCEHQGKLDRTLKRLKESKSAFYHALELLESDPVCCGLSLHSFLMLPMQRITRLPLLVDAVLSKLKLDDDEFDSWKITLAILNKIVGQCNEAANRSEQAFELENLSRQIEFPPNIRPLAIVPVGVPAPGTVSRSLVRRGELTHIIWRGDDGKLTFGKKFTKTNIYIFLFTDLVVLAKKRSDDSFTVFDYCPRSLLTVSSGDIIPQLPAKELVLGGKHLIFMTLLENHEGKMIEMILACPSETERQRWLHATQPPESENPDEKLYEQWDCPQVIAKHTYLGLQRDELNLDPGDVVNVTRKMADGWYHGERIRDGAQGWFPGNYTEEVASTHVRARNLKQRYRLLTFTAAYWESQKKK